MAEVIGLVTAIGSIATAGVKIAQVISIAADDFGTAASKVKAIATDMRTIGMILRQIKHRLNGWQNPASETVEVLSKIVLQCKIDIDEIESCLSPLIGKAGESMNLMQKLRWLFAKSKIYGKQAALDSLKLTLTLFLHTMDVLDGDEIGYVPLINFRRCHIIDKQLQRLERGNRECHVGDKQDKRGFSKGGEV